MKIDTVKLECMLNHFLAAVQEVYEGSSAHVLNALDLIRTDPKRAEESPKISRAMSSLIPTAKTCSQREFVHLANKVIEVFEKAAMEGHIEQLEKIEVIPVDEETYIVRKHLLMTEDEVDDILAGVHFGVAEQT
ncbi:MULTISPECIES: hypothetical protein [Achromobacter]|uniref:hypothetical protein n=1 Tax=Achromobacter TaxID=222 RepID=UPI0006BFD46F|nr:MULTISPECIES: hypothetical protein [Achromobacter]CUJ72055.1 Uncharacterised protein [Achromobacter xylosoxidans]